MAEARTSPFDRDLRAIDDELLQAAVPVLEPLGMSPTLTRIMYTLILADGPLTMQELAERTGYSPSSLSTSVRLLEGVRKVRRETRPGSKRVFVSVATLDLSKALVLQLFPWASGSRSLRDIARHVIVHYEELGARLAREGGPPELKALVERRLQVMRKLEGEYQRTYEVMTDVFDHLRERHGVSVDGVGASLGAFECHAARPERTAGERGGGGAGRG